MSMSTGPGIRKGKGYTSMGNVPTVHIRFITTHREKESILSLNVAAYIATTLCLMHHATITRLNKIQLQHKSQYINIS